MKIIKAQMHSRNVSNYIIELFKKFHLKINFNPNCNVCGKSFKDHTDEDLKKCVMN